MESSIVSHEIERISTLRRASHRCDLALKLAERVCRDLRDGAICSRRFEEESNLNDLLQVVHRRLEDTDTPVSFELNDPLRG